MIEIFSCFLFLAKPTQNGTAGCVKLLLFFPSCYCACNYESTEHRVGILHFEILTSSFFCDVRCCLALVVHFSTVAALSFVFVGVFRLKHTTLSKDSIRASSNVDIMQAKNYCSVVCPLALRFGVLGLLGTHTRTRLIEEKRWRSEGENFFFTLNSSLCS